MRFFLFFFFNCWLYFGRVEGSLNDRGGEGGEASKAACQQVAAV